MNKTLMTAMLALGVAGTAAQAQPYYGMPYAGPGYGMGPGPMYGQPAPQPRVRAAERAGPAVMLREGMEKLLAFLRQNQRPSPEQLQAFLDQEIAPFFDFAYMTRWAAGAMSRQMSDEQMVRMQEKLKSLFLGSMAEHLAGYSNQAVHYLRPRRTGENEVTLRVAIENPRGYPAELEFRLYKSDAGWKVFDVSANGNSALMHYRRHFARAMRQQMSAGRPPMGMPPRY